IYVVTTLASRTLPSPTASPPPPHPPPSSSMIQRPPPPTLFPYTTLFRSLPPKVRIQERNGDRPEDFFHDLPSLDELQRRYFMHLDRKSTRLNSSHLGISYAVFCLKKKKINVVLNVLSLTNHIRYVLGDVH